MEQNKKNLTTTPISNHYEQQNQQRGVLINRHISEITDLNKELRVTRISSLLYRGLGALMIAGTGYEFAKGAKELAAIFAVGGFGMGAFGRTLKSEANKQQKVISAKNSRFRRGL